MHCGRQQAVLLARCRLGTALQLNLPLHRCMKFWSVALLYIIVGPFCSLNTNVATVSTWNCSGAQVFVSVIQPLMII